LGHPSSFPQQESIHFLGVLRGAHLLLQVRVQELNGDLRSAFQRWYPRMALCNDEQRAA
jgi:hypothetical protein